MKKYTFKYERYLDKLQIANNLLEVSPEPTVVKNLIYSLLSIYSEEHQVHAYLAKDSNLWYIEPQFKPTGAFEQKLNIGSICDIILVSFYNYTRYPYQNGLNVQFIEDKLILPLYQSVCSYSVQNNSCRLQSLPAITSVFNRNCLLLWMLNLFASHTLLQQYLPAYRQLCHCAFGLNIPNYFKSFIEYKGIETYVFDGCPHECEKYYAPHILFLAYKDFELYTLKHHIRGYRVCRDCGSLFELRHGNQKLCCLCGSHLRHPYNITRKRLSKIFDNVAEQFTSADDREILTSFLAENAIRQNQLKTYILHNTKPAPEYFDKYADFLSHMDTELQSYSTMLYIQQLLQ